MPDVHKNFAYSTVAAAPAPALSGLALTLAAGDGALFGFPSSAVVWPAGAQPLASNAEIVRVTNIVGDVLTIVRGPQAGDPGGVNRTIVVGDQIMQGPTAKTSTDAEAGQSTLQNGVVLATDAALSATSVAGGSGVLTYTLAAASPLWVMSAAGLLVPIAFAGATGATLAPGALPATTKYRGYGIEIDTTGAVSLSSGGTDQTTAAAALTNINTVPAAGKVRVADVVILNTAGVYSLSATRDRRPWARGALAQAAGSGSGSNYTTTSAPMVAVDTTWLQLRLECTGAPARLGAVLTAYGNGTFFGIYMDGVMTISECEADNVGVSIPLTLDALVIPSAGSRLFTLMWAAKSGTTTMPNPAFGSANGRPIMTVEELVRQSANNGTS